MSTIRYFHSEMIGAPVLSGTPGTLLNVLDACLVTGFGLTSVASTSVSNGVATATASLGHIFEADCSVRLESADHPELNGDFAVTSVTATTFTFKAAVPDGAYTRHITAKLAPADWERIDGGANVAAYRSADLASSGCYLQIDDTDYQKARVTGFESMVYGDAGERPFPSTLQATYYWPKSSTSNDAARYWVFVGNSKTFWLYVGTTNSTSGYGLSGLLFGFGDLASRKAGDPYACVLYGSTNSSIGAVTSELQSACYNSAQNAPVTVGHVARSYTGIGGSRPVFNAAEAFGGSAHYSGDGYMSYPCGPDGALLLSRMMAIETTPRNPRGTVRGLFFCPQSLGYAFANKDRIAGRGTLEGRTLLALKGSSPALSSDTYITSFLDITGPWD